MSLMEADGWRVLADRWSAAATGRKKREVWSSVYAAMLARLYLRHCTRVGSLTRTYGRPRIVNQGGAIIIGERVQVWSTTVRTELVALEGAMLEIGDRAFLNYGTSICATGQVRVGRDCMLGTYAMILDNDFHEIEHRHIRPKPRPVTLEDNVWLGNRVMVLPGVTIGHDAVIGAGSVVVKDIPPRSVAVGNPAHVIRTF